MQAAVDHAGGEVRTPTGAYAATGPLPSAAMNRAWLSAAGVLRLANRPGAVLAEWRGHLLAEPLFAVSFAIDGELGNPPEAAIGATGGLRPRETNAGGV